jgi:hypothetical protein
VIIEEFMEGPELSLDAIICRGEITVCGVADRHIFFHPYFVEMGHTMPTGLGTREVREAEKVFHAGIRAIGIDRGAAKGDIKLTPWGAMVGEIAARLSGGYMSGWTFPLSSGVEVTEAALNIAVGLPPGDMRPRTQRVSAERAFISIPGTVREISGIQEARSAQGVQEVFLRVQEGQEVVFPTNNVEKCGNVITCADSRRTAIEDAERAISAITIRLSPLNPSTDAFLLPQSGPYDGRNAFRLSVRENIEAFAAMSHFSGDPSFLQPSGQIRVLPLPSIAAETCRDWHGLPVHEAVSRIARAGRVVFQEGKSDNGFALGKIFWHALLRGGTQGALYLVDSMREAADRHVAKEYLHSVCGR